MVQLAALNHSSSTMGRSILLLWRATRGKFLHIWPTGRSWKEKKTQRILVAEREHNARFQRLVPGESSWSPAVCACDEDRLYLWRQKKKKLQPKLRETHSIDNELAFNCPSLCYQGESNAHYSEQHRAREDPSQQRLLGLHVDTTTDLLHMWLPCKVREQTANSALLLLRGEGSRGWGRRGKSQKHSSQL